MQFSMNETWQRGIALVSNNFQLLALIAGVFLFLPAVVIYLAVPDLASFMDPGADPAEMAARMEKIQGPLIGWGLLAMVLQFIGYLAMVGLIGSTRPTVGEAIGRGAKALLTLIGCLILFVIIYLVVGVLLMVPIVLVVGESDSSGLGIVGFLLVFALIGFIMTRLSITMPVIMLENQLNPAAALWRSWKLTGPHKWAIFGFWVLLVVAYLVIAILLFGVFGLIGAMAASSGVGLFVMGIVNGTIGALVSMLVSGLIVAMYQQLAGDRPENLNAEMD